ncbi:MAG: hypothetical protein EKK64_06190 [Neisseriaceae bacterium]|nr:MAG: hypothetical protein EKK64_06190 [Neisseriaceae bacterium]
MKEQQFIEADMPPPTGGSAMPPMGAGSPPAGTPPMGGGMPPMGGDPMSMPLGGAGGGLGGGAMPPMGGMPPSGAVPQAQSKLKSYNVWDVLEKILEK